MTHRIRKSLITVGALLLIFSVAAVTVFHTDWFAHWLSERASARLGHRVVVRSLGIEWQLPPRLYATDIHIANAWWSDRPEMAVIERVWVQPAWSHLLLANLVANELGLVRPYLLLQVSREGRRNWDGMIGGDGGGGGGERSVKSLVIVEGRLEYLDRAASTQIEVAVEQPALREASSGFALTVKGSGTWRGEAVTVSGRSGPLLDLLGTPGADVPLEAGVSTASSQLVVAGSVASLQQLQKAELEFSGKGEDVGQLAALGGFDVATRAAYRFDGRVTRDRGAINANVKGRLGDAPLSGSAHYRSDGHALEALLDVGPNSARIDGTLAFEPQRAVAVRFSLDVREPRALGPLGEMLVRDRDAARLPAFALTGEHVHDPSLWAIRQLDGRIGDAAVTGRAMLHRSSREFDVDLTLGGNRLQASGHLPRLEVPESASLKFDVAVPRPATLDSLVGILRLPYPRGLPPHALRGRVLTEQDTWRLREAQGNVGGLALSAHGTIRLAEAWEARGELALGQSNLVADLTIGTPRERPNVTGRLSSDAVVVSELRSLLESRGGDDQGSGQVPLFADVLRSFDADVGYRAERVKFTGADIGSARVEVALDSGILDLSTARLELGDGSVALNGRIDGAGSGVNSTLTLELDGVSLGTLASGTKVARKLDAVAHAKLEGSGRGSTLGRWLANVSGTAQMHLTQGTVARELVEKMSVDLFAMLMAKPRATVPIRCAAAELRLVDGIARILGLAIETPDTRVLGRGTLDLAARQLDVHLVPKAAGSGTQLITSRIHLTGTLADPAVDSSVETQFFDADRGLDTELCAA